MAITVFGSTSRFLGALGVPLDETGLFTDPMNTMADGVVAPFMGQDEPDESNDLPDELGDYIVWQESPATKFFDRFINPLTKIAKTTHAGILGEWRKDAALIPIPFATMPPAQAAVVAPFMGLMTPDESSNYGPDELGKDMSSAPPDEGDDSTVPISSSASVAVHAKKENNGGFFTDFNALLLFLRDCDQDAGAAKTAAERVASKLISLVEGEGLELQSQIEERFGRQEMFAELRRVVHHVNLIAGTRLKAKRSADPSINVSIRPGRPKPFLQEAYARLREVLFERFKGTDLLCSVLEEIEKYANSFVHQPYAWAARSETHRIHFYAALFAEISKLFDAFGVSMRDAETNAEKIFQRFAGSNAEKPMSLPQVRNVWVLGAELFRDRISADSAEKVLKGYYGYSDEEFASLMAEIPDRYLELTYPFLVDKMDMWPARNRFEMRVRDLAPRYKAAGRGFKRAAKLLGVDRSPETMDELAVKAAATAHYSGGGNRKKPHMAEITGWRQAVSAADLKMFDWETLKNALAGALDITGKEVEKLFAEVLDDELRVYLARHALEIIDKCQGAASMKHIVIDSTLERLETAVAATKGFLAMFPGGKEVPDEYVRHEVALAIIRLFDIAFDHLEAIRVIKKLKGEDFLFNGFSADAVSNIRKLGIESYFGWFYPETQGLPQVLIEANLNYLAMYEEVDYFVRAHVHKHRADFFRKLRGQIDERLKAEELDEQERAKIRDEAMQWIAEQSSDARRLVIKIVERQFWEWLDRRISGDPLLSADMPAWEHVTNIMGKLRTMSGRQMLEGAMPEVIRSAEVSASVAESIFAFLTPHALEYSDRQIRWVFFGRIEFYINVLKEIGVAAELLGLKGADAVSFAKGLLAETEDTAAKMRTHYLASTIRKLVWFIMAKKHIDDPSINVKRGILERFYGLNIGEYVPEHLMGSGEFSEFLSYRLKMLKDNDLAIEFKKRIKAWVWRFSG